MELRGIMYDKIRSELEDIDVREHVSTKDADKMTYGVDYFWIPRMWADRGKCPPFADYIVWPESPEQISKILKIANYYKLPCIHGGGSAARAAPCLWLAVSFWIQSA